MIRYLITKSALEALITNESADWLTRAAERTKEFKKLGRFEEASSIWSEVKTVYMKLQGDGKCAYCERQMESPSAGKVEQDVEHFRPKGNVKAWKAPQKLKDLGISFTAIPGRKKGYHLLSYHLWNYAAACKPCNSALKSDCFPIAGKYKLAGADPAKLKSEKPYLIYPIGNLDANPETLIEFHGTSPVPVPKSGHRRNRAMVTIEFFKLDDPEERKNLYRDRSILIMALYSLLQETRIGAVAQKAAAENTLKEFLKPELKHLNCAKSFVRLFNKDRAEAKIYYDAAVFFMSKNS